MISDIRLNTDDIFADIVNTTPFGAQRQQLRNKTKLDRAAQRFLCKIHTHITAEQIPVTGQTGKHAQVLTG